ncbi:MAG TPA: hypothetical protein PKA27_07920 [Fimbriimonadaceae bacterium]|nr:hypothetical protein [Fimbriimonadaceae bacterium]
MKLLVPVLLAAAATAQAVFPNNPESGFPAVGMCGDWNGTTFTQWGTGTAVAPNWVLTARHVGGTHFWQNGTYYAVQQKFYHPQADLALWRMSSSIPSYAPIAFRPFSGVAALQGQVTRFVGYGVTAQQLQNSWNPISGSFGVKRSTVNTIDFEWPSFFVNFGSYTRTTDYILFDLDDPAGVNPNNTYGGTAISGEGGIAEKDSGSPWFVTEGGLDRVVAVSSVIGHYNGGGVTNPLQYGAWACGTHLFPYKTWVQQTAVELGTLPTTALDFSSWGTLLSGHLALLSSADGQYIRIRSKNMEQLDLDVPVGTWAGFRNAVAFPRSISISVTQRSSGGNGTSNIYLRNWASGSFELVGSTPISGSFSAATLNNVSAVNRVRSDGRIEVFISQGLFINDLARVDADFDQLTVISSSD